MFFNPFSALCRYFAPAPPIKRLPDDAVRRLYPRYRWRIMESTFIGYATFYLLRKGNLATVAKEMEEALVYDKADIGLLMAAASISYGVGKFLMGAVSDRSDPRKFMAAGLLISAVCNFVFGWVTGYWIHLTLWTINGFVQGMGWPPCGRSMGHWFSTSERGLTFSIWNTSHNLGGGIAGVLAAWAFATYGGWEYAFFVPGIISAVGAVYLFFRLRDTPQSVGLPPIEEYRQDFPEGAIDRESLERNLTAKELFVDKVLLNQYVWLLAIANFFAYIARYALHDWGPTYLKEVKGASLQEGGLAILVMNFGGIPSTIMLGWISDLAGGRRGMVSALCMIPVVAAYAVILVTPEGYLWVDMTMLAMIGFFIYPVINLIVIAALDVASKKAIGTAAGFIGLFGYLGTAAENYGFGWMVDHYTTLYGEIAAWNMVLYTILACSALAGILLAFTWHARPKA
ncbi:MAG: MFS transporter [Pirellulales bacterium]|nr:MFS transporter [Pirellulales bacterium]